MAAPVISQLLNSLKGQSKLQLAEHAIVLGAALYLTKKVSQKGLSIISLLFMLNYTD
jgi:hypothetical protein